MGQKSCLVTWSIDPADLRKILQTIPPSGADFESNSDLPSAMIFTETGKLDQEKIKMLVLAQDKVSYLQFDFHIEKFGIPSQILKLAENRIVVFLKIDIISKDVI